MNKPYTLHLGDCLEIMAYIPDRSVDMVLADPPYGTTRNRWDSVIPLPEMWAQLRRVVKPGGAVVMTASQPFTSVLVCSNLPWFRHEWIWQKNKATGHLNAKRSPLKAHESILVFSSAAPPYYPQMTDGHPPANAFYTRTNGNNYGAGSLSSGGGSTVRYPRSVQCFPVVNNDDPEKTHPTQKPVAMMEYLIRTYSCSGQVVMDFAMGSGSAGVACARTGRQFIGIEIEIQQMGAAEARIAREFDVRTLAAAE